MLVRFTPVVEKVVFFYEFTAIQYEAQLRQTWIDYFANVGGAFGLCLGFSITTLAELVWLILRLMARIERRHFWQLSDLKQWTKLMMKYVTLFICKKGFNLMTKK
jgi:hypothetical protein